MRTLAAAQVLGIVTIAVLGAGCASAPAKEPGTVGEVGTVTGDLGFELAAVFQSDPNLGSLRFNTQFAEEAFTVYDHPKVLIFRKTADYDPDKVRAILEAVDISRELYFAILLDRATSAPPGRSGGWPAARRTPAPRARDRSRWWGAPTSTASGTT